MANLLIVDDEPEIRIALKKMVSSHYQDVFQIYQAENGERALEIAFSIKIDIMITDIKMPVCTGLEMMEKLKSQKYFCQTIVVSGFDEYSLVREAMKLGACDYLLKPIDSEEFYKLVDNCLIQLTASQALFKRNESYIENLEKTLYKNQYALTNLLNLDHTEDSLSILAGQGLEQMHFCTVAVLDIFQNSLQKSVLKKAWAYEITETLNRDFPAEYHLIQGEQKNLWVLLFFHSTKYENGVFTRIIKELYQKKVKLSISPPTPLTDLQAEFFKCIQNLELFFYDITEMPVTSQETFPFQPLLNSMLESAVSIDYENFCLALQNWFSLACREKPPMEQVKQILTALIYTIMQGNNKYIRIIGDYKFTNHDIIETIGKSFSASALKKDMMKIMNIYMEEVLSNIAQSDEFYIQRAKKYIHNNYFKEITLTEISNHLSIHPNYFSSMFKQKNGTSFVRYLRKVRIEEACRKIKETNQKFYEIAEAVGYHDPIQFNRAFKLETGESPGSYKKKIDLG